VLSSEYLVPSTILKVNTVTSAELAQEMAAARQRREEKTARQIREARAHAIRAAMPPGSTREDIELRARHFYPRLSDELLDEAVSLVYVQSRSAVSGPQQP
jgi:hypothetical protein